MEPLVTQEDLEWARRLRDAEPEYYDEPSAWWDRVMAAEHASWRAEVEKLRAENERLSECDCGRDLSKGLCSVCDNDE